MKKKRILLTGTLRKSTDPNAPVRNVRFEVQRSEEPARRPVGFRSSIQRTATTFTGEWFDESEPNVNEGDEMILTLNTGREIILRIDQVAELMDDLYKIYFSLKSDLE